MTRRIVVIDDEITFGKLLKMHIEAMGGYEVLLADSGEGGLELIQAHRPDLVLLDIMMPGIGGWETLKRIKAPAPELPVAMLTALWKEEQTKPCFADGAYDYLIKPVDFQYIKRVVLGKLQAKARPGSSEPAGREA